MPLCTNVTRIGSKYYFRRRIPKDLKRFFGKETYKVSLKTACPIEARERAAKVASQLVDFFRSLRVMTQDNDNDEIDYDFSKYADYDEADIDSDFIDEFLADEPIPEDERLTEEDQEALLKQIDQEKRDNDLYMLGLMRLNEKKIEKMTQESEVKNRIIADLSVSQSNPAKSNDVNSVEKRFLEFLSERQSQITPNFYNFHSLVFRFFTEICGTKNMVDYNRSDANNYRNTVLKLPTYPSNWEKHFGTTEISKVIELNKTKRKPTVSKKTFNSKHLAVLGPFFKWSKQLGYVDHNIFDDMTTSLTAQEKNVKRKEKRPPFTIEELNNIFSSTEFTNRHKDYVYFAPLVLLFSGMRFGELAQLKIKDIVDHNGSKHFNLTGDDKSLKNVNAYRLIPVHDELRKIGLFEYIDERLKRTRNPDSPMFDISYNEKTHGYDSRRLLRLLKTFKDHGTLGEHVVVHSFRHTFRNHLVSSGVDSESIAMAMGHEDEGSRIGGIYSDNLIKKPQSKKVLSLCYEGLNLSHLYCSP